MAGVKGKSGGARDNAGADSMFKGSPKRKITLNLTEEVIDILTDKSKELKISRSDLINNLVLENR